MDFAEIREMVCTAVTRLSSPMADYPLVFTEMDDSIEIRVEDITKPVTSVLFAMSIDADRFRVIKDMSLPEDGQYFSAPYSGPVKLLSYIIEYYYPVCARLDKEIQVTKLVSRLFLKNIRIWKDIVKVLCDAGGVEFKNLGGGVHLLDTHIFFNPDTRIFTVKGSLEDARSCRSVMELVVATLSYLDYLFMRDGYEFDPFEEAELQPTPPTPAEEANAEMEGAMADMGMGDDMGLGDLGGDFVDDSAMNTAPDLAEGKAEIAEAVTDI